MPEAKIELSISHLRLDLTNERGCFAMSSLTNHRDPDAMIRMREEIFRISQENNQETPPSTLRVQVPQPSREY